MSGCSPPVDIADAVPLIQMTLRKDPRDWIPQGLRRVLGMWPPTPEAVKVYMESYEMPVVRAKKPKWPAALLAFRRGARNLGRRVLRRHEGRYLLYPRQKYKGLPAYYWWHCIAHNHKFKSKGTSMTWTASGYYTGCKLCREERWRPSYFEKWRYDPLRVVLSEVRSMLAKTNLTDPLYISLRKDEEEILKQIESRDQGQPIS